MSDLLDLPSHCARAADLIRLEPERWCQRRMHDPTTGCRCGLGWVLHIGSYTIDDGTSAISIVNRANYRFQFGVPFAVFNDTSGRTARQVADRLDQIAELLGSDDPGAGST